MSDENQKKQEDAAVQATEGEEEVKWERWQKKRIFVRGTFRKVRRDL